MCLQSLGLKSLHPTLVTLGRLGLSAGKVFAIRLSPTHLAILSVEGDSVKVIKDLNNVSDYKFTSFWKLYVVVCGAWQVKYTVKCHYNAVQFFTLHTVLRWQWQNIDQTLNSQHTSWVSYGVSVVRMSEKIDQLLMALHCTWNIISVDEQLLFKSLQMFLHTAWSHLR